MKMRKITGLLLVAALLAGSAGCSILPTPTTEATYPSTQETTPETTQETTIETTIPEVTDPSVTYHVPMAAVSMPVVTETNNAADGTPLFTYTYQNLNLFLPEAPVADKIFVDFQNQLDELHASARDLNAAATAAYAGQDGWEPFSLLVQYQPIRFDEMVLSFFAAKTIFDGNTRSNSTNFFVTYDLLTGNALGIRDILVADYSADDLVELIVQGLAHYEEQELLFPDYQELISDMFFTNRPVENWYFAPDGLCFFFNPYEIAPHSTGSIVCEIPYDALGGLLKDSYFPGEAVSFAGNPKVVDFNAANTESISNFAELILSESGKEYLLCADGTMLNVRIEAGALSENSADFTVFAASSISKGDAVLIQCDDIADLILVYESQGTTQRYFFSAQ